MAVPYFVPVRMVSLVKHFVMFAEHQAEKVILVMRHVLVRMDFLVMPFP